MQQGKQNTYFKVGVASVLHATKSATSAEMYGIRYQTLKIVFDVCVNRTEMA